MDKNQHVKAAPDTVECGLICSWLGLPAGNWPPDHYTLLGLPRGETDLGRIEQQVHDRLARLRCFQCSHPATATEAMNRLAPAFLCLSDASGRKAYNATLDGGKPPSTTATPSKTPVTTKTAMVK